MAAIANRIGLERFLTICWPSLHAQFPDIKFILIGDMGSAVSEGLRPLLLQPNLQSLGFVPDLPEVMRPYDLFIIPYEFDTGTRTRLPLALNYKQLLVVHKNACRGIDGLKHMENCLMANSLEEMTSLIGDVLSGRIDYKPIADRGKMLFGQAFTVEGQLTRMKTFLSAIFGQ
jgi:hypothetical protein